MSLLNNYGCVLQNYALQTTLKKIGHEPITLDYIPYKSPFRILVSLAYTVVLFFTKRRRTFAECFPIKRDKHVANFIKKNLSVTYPLQGYNTSLIQEYNLGGFVVGSDQIWRPLYNDDILHDAYLEFTEGYDVKRVAYAASFGVSHWEYSQKETEICARLAQRFDAISVRESSGVELCKEYLHVEAKTVLDPTLLLDANDYRQLINKKRNQNKYILTYILNASDEKQLFVERIADRLNSEIVSISLGNKLEYSVEEWLGLFDAAEYVVTDSFHGTVFSIIFHKSFTVIDNPSRGSARMLSLLKLLGTENRLLKEETLNSSENIEEFINWNTVDSYLKQAQRDGVDFLSKALSF